MIRFSVLGLVLAAACSDSFDPPSRLEGLRVLDVAVDKPYAPPGTTVKLEMLALETSAKPYQIVWLGGCEDPDGDLASGCLDELNASISELTPEQLAGDAPASAPLGFGPSYTWTLAPDLITRRPPPSDGTTPYGLAYVYFALCTGELRVVDPPQLGLVLGCFDGDTPVDATGFITGYTPLFAYDTLTNAPPQISDVQIDATVKTCTKKDIDDCPDVHVVTIVDPSQSELDEAAFVDSGEPLHELLWAAFYTTVGEFEDDTQIIADTNGSIRALDDSRGAWHVQPGYTGPATIYVVLYDSRGGSTFTRRDVMVVP